MSYWYYWSRKISSFWEQAVLYFTDDAGMDKYYTDDATLDPYTTEDD